MALSPNQYDIASTLATVATTGAYSDLSGRPSLATVATTGAYADLTGEPTNQSASSGSSTVSLCTRGEKYTWNHKSNALTTAKVTIATSSISAGSVKDFTASVAKTGYTPLGIVMVEINAGGNNTVLVNFLISGTTGRVRLCNTGSSAFTPSSVDITVLYVAN